MIARWKSLQNMYENILHRMNLLHLPIGYFSGANVALFKCFPI